MSTQASVRTVLQLSIVRTYFIIIKVLVLDEVLLTVPVLQVLLLLRAMRKKSQHFSSTFRWVGRKNLLVYCMYFGVVGEKKVATKPHTPMQESGVARPSSC